MEKNEELNEMKRRLEGMKKDNRLSPFPIHDTDDIKDLEEAINNIINEDYDELPVAACKYCKSLHILNDELENDVCAKCGAVNEVEIYNNINEYLNERQQEQEEIEE